MAPRTPKPYESAPRPPVFPLPPEDHALLARLNARGVEICGVCVSWDLDAPIGKNGLAYCRRRCTWEFPWSEPCSNFTRRPTDG